MFFILISVRPNPRPNKKILPDVYHIGPVVSLLELEVRKGPLKGTVPGVFEKLGAV